MIQQHFGVRILKLNLLIVQAGCPVLFYQMPPKQREQSIFPDRSQQIVRGLRWVWGYNLPRECLRIKTTWLSTEWVCQLASCSNCFPWQDLTSRGRAALVNSRIHFLQSLNDNCLLRLGELVAKSETGGWGHDWHSLTWDLGLIIPVFKARVFWREGRRTMFFCLEKTNEINHRMEIRMSCLKANNSLHSFKGDQIACTVK